MNSKHVIGEIETRSIERVVEWQFEERNLLNAQYKESFYSPSFSFASSSWVLRIYTGVVQKPREGRPAVVDRIPKYGLFLSKLTPMSKVNVRAGIDIILSDNTRKCIEIKKRLFVDKDKGYGAMILNYSDIPEGEPGAKAKVVCTIRDLKFAENSPTIIEDLKSLYGNKEGCDVRIVVQGEEFPAHKAILIARSPVFASMFRKHEARKIIKIADCKTSILSDFLFFMYCDTIENISERNVFELFSMSCKYDVRGLREMCVKFMKNNLSLDTFYTTISLALKHSDSDLTEIAIDYFIKNVKEIVLTVNWDRFTSENTMLSNKLLTKAVLTLTENKV